MPLVPMMRMLLNNMHIVNEGIYTENFAMINEGGQKIANHPVMTQKEKELVKTTLGEQMKQFVAFDMTVHHHADSLADAARRQNMEAVLEHYRIVQQGCVDCHTSFRTTIINARNQADE
jgi:cytochrome c556